MHNQEQGTKFIPVSNITLSVTRYHIINNFTGIGATSSCFGVSSSKSHELLFAINEIINTHKRMWIYFVFPLQVWIKLASVVPTKQYELLTTGLKA